MPQTWEENIITGVFLWYTTQKTDRYVKTIGDWTHACYVKELLDRHNIPCELRDGGQWNEIVIERSELDRIEGIEWE